ncbi:MAG: response regulator transcription factor [Deltaproteobacteria bacterium]|nr:response regulator transcription factor [Deltaproteobacteria bacterium]
MGERRDGRAGVLLVDDHTIVRQGLRMLLGSWGEIEVVGEADCGVEALRMVRHLEPDLVLLDLSLPDMDGVELIHQILGLGGRTRVVVLSMHASPGYVRPALHAGAVGYLVKGADVADLQRALAAALRGETWLSPSVARALLDPPSRGPLSLREEDVLRLVAQGKTSREIASILGISVKTVDNHRQNLMEKLGIHEIAGLTRYALKAGLVGPE